MSEQKREKILYLIKQIKREVNELDPQQDRGLLNLIRKELATVVDQPLIPKGNILYLRNER